MAAAATTVIPVTAMDGPDMAMDARVMVMAVIQGTAIEAQRVADMPEAGIAVAEERSTAVAPSTATRPDSTEAEAMAAVEADSTAVAVMEEATVEGIAKN
jgi:hypothetical protein